MALSKISNINYASDPVSDNYRVNDLYVDGGLFFPPNTNPLVYSTFTSTETLTSDTASSTSVSVQVNGHRIGNQVNITVNVPNFTGSGPLTNTVGGNVYAYIVINALPVSWRNNTDYLSPTSSFPLSFYQSTTSVASNGLCAMQLIPGLSWGLMLGVPGLSNKVEPFATNAGTSYGPTQSFSISYYI